MKKSLLTALAVLASAFGGGGQGFFVLDNASLTEGGVAIDASGNYYSGTFGMEVWKLNTASLPAGLNAAAALSGVAAHRLLIDDGFALEAIFAGQQMQGGSFSLGSVKMPDVQPPGATVVVALAIWNGGAPSWTAMLGGASSTTRAGVLAFVQPTTDYEIVNPPNAPDLGWGSSYGDLVMLAVPEPSALALAGLGGVLLLVLCGRRSRARRSLPWRTLSPGLGAAPGPVPPQGALRPDAAVASPSRSPENRPFEI